MTSPPRPEEELAQPATSAARLAEIATARIDLAATIARHPNAHEALLDWIVTYGDDAARAAVHARRAGQQAQPSYPQAQPQPPIARPEHPAQAAQQPGHAMPSSSSQPQPGVSGQQPGAGYPSPFGAANASPSPQGQSYPQGQPYAQGQPYPQGQPAPGYPGQAPYGQQAPQKKSRKGLVIGLVAGGVVVLLAGGGVAWAAAAGLFGGGSKTPQAAAEKVVDGLLDVDPVALYTSLAPSETRYLEDAVDTLGDIDASGDDDYVEAMQEMLDAVEVTSAGLQYETDELMPEVARVRLVGGTVTVDGDAARISEAVSTLIDAEYDGDDFFSDYYSEEELEQMKQDQRDELERQIGETFPYTIDFAEEWANVADTSAVDPSDPEALARAYRYSIIAVDEGGWFVSPLLTATELALGAGGGDAGAYGTSIIDAQPFDSPEAALQGLADGISDYASSGDYTEFARALPLAERRWVSLFGDSLGMGAGSGGADITFSNLEATSQIDGDRAAIEIQNLDIASSGTSVNYSHPCLSAEDYYGDTQRYCLTDLKPLELLGLDDAKPIAVKEDGGWLVGPIATVSTIAGTAAENYRQLVEEDRVDELFDLGSDDGF